MIRLLPLLSVLLLAPVSLRAAEGPAEVKVVVLAMFELGADTGDKPGEYQRWVEGRHLDQVIPLPAGYHDLRTDGKGVYATVTGMGTAHSASSVMALGLDPRLDFSHAYWLVAGIAGIDPARGSIGSAVWADYVVDGDLAREIDAREIPAGWPTGFVPLGSRSTPYEQPRPEPEGEVYALNGGLARWAWKTTRGVPLQETDEMRKKRALYAGFPAAQGRPQVLLGATLSASTFWHGKLLNRWAQDWVNYWTEGKGTYYTTAMEDTGTLQALTNLAKAGRVDLRRVMVLRTASNFDSQAPGGSAAEDLRDEVAGHSYSAYLPSIQAAYDVGNTIVAEIADHWGAYRDKVPGG